MIGQPHDVPDLLAPIIEAGADEVILSFAFGTPEAIAQVGDALGLS